MAEKNITPAVSAFVGELTQTALAKKSLSSAVSVYTETALVEELSAKLEAFVKKTAELSEAVAKAEHFEGDNLALASYYRETVFALMGELRELGDAMEKKTAAKYWPYPSYGEILFGV